MAKNAAKKRRRGVKVKVKQKNTAFHKKLTFTNAQVQASWDPKKSAAQNLRNIGVAADANDLVNEGEGAQGARKEVAEHFAVPDSDDLRVVDRNFRRRPMSEEDQMYIASLMRKHGEDYKAMQMDIELNVLQLEEGKCKRLVARFRLLEDHQRFVEIPPMPKKKRRPL